MVDLQRLGPDVLAGILPLLYQDVLREAYAHQDAGRPAYIVTAASQELAEVLAHVLVLDGGIGMRSEVRDGVYTGRPAGPFTYREGKAEAIREIAAREGIDLAESFAYSDSESDLPMMRAVGNPVAVNPDAALEKVARSEGWRIMRFDRLGPLLKIGVGAARRRARRRGRRLCGRPRAPAEAQASEPQVTIAARRLLHVGMPATVVKFPATDLRTSAENVLRGNDNGGYTVPSRATYPHQWNWDSALRRARLGGARPAARLARARDAGRRARPAGDDPAHRVPHPRAGPGERDACAAR